jgi:putative endonuclease
MDKNYYVYILASRRNGTLYIGVTSDLVKRTWEHKNKVVAGFTKRYGVDKLVYFEQFSDSENAIKREKRLKKYNRKWKLELVEKGNPEWRDLFDEIASGLPDQVGQ